MRPWFGAWAENRPPISRLVRCVLVEFIVGFCRFEVQESNWTSIAEPDLDLDGQIRVFGERGGLYPHEESAEACGRTIDVPPRGGGSAD